MLKACSSQCALAPDKHSTQFTFVLKREWSIDKILCATRTNVTVKIHSLSAGYLNFK
jgi:hypothetical protein